MKAKLTAALALLKASLRLAAAKTAILWLLAAIGSRLPSLRLPALPSLPAWRRPTLADLEVRAADAIAAEQRSFAEIWRNRLVWPALAVLLVAAYVGGHHVASMGVRGLRTEIGTLRNSLATAKEETGKAKAEKRELTAQLSTAERDREAWKAKAEAKLAAAAQPAPAAAKKGSRK